MTITAENDMFCFGGEPLKVYKLSNAAIYAKNDRPNLKFVEDSRQKRSYYSLAKVMDDKKKVLIWLTGGHVDNVNSASVSLFREAGVKDARFTEEKSMNVARSWHASCILEAKLYVFGGWGVENKLLNSIEFLDTSAEKEDHAWTETTCQFFTPRMSSAVIPIGANKIAIFGGSCNKEVIIYDPDSDNNSEVAA